MVKNCFACPSATAVPASIVEENERRLKTKLVLAGALVYWWYRRLRSQRGNDEIPPALRPPTQAPVLSTSEALISPNSITITWDPNIRSNDVSRSTQAQVLQASRNTTYNVYSCFGENCPPNNLEGNVTVNEYTYNNLPPGTTVGTSVAGVNPNSGAEGPRSAPIVATTLPAFNPVTSITANAISPTEIELSWSPVTNATYYAIYELDTGTGEYVLNYFTPTDATTFTVDTLIPGTEYSFQVAGARLSYIGPTGVLTAQATTFPILNGPLITSIIAFSYNTMLLQWNKIASATYYQLFRKESLGSGDFVMIADFIPQPLDPSETSLVYEDKDGLLPLTNYSYRCRGVFQASTEPPLPPPYFGNFSNTASNTTLTDAVPGTPVLNTPFFNTPTSISLSWSLVPDAVTYRIWRIINGGTPTDLTNGFGTGGLIWTDSTFGDWTNNLTYFVQAVNSANPGEMSNSQKLTQPRGFTRSIQANASSSRIPTSWAFRNGNFVGVSPAGCVRSEDYGRTILAASNEVFTKIINAPVGLVALNSTSRIVRISTDSGNTWTNPTSFSFPQDINSIAYGRYLGSQDTYVIVGNNNSVFISTDNCVTWTAATVPSPTVGSNNYMDVTFGENTFMAVSGTNVDQLERVIKSVNGGTNWTFVATFDNLNFRRIAFAPGINTWAIMPDIPQGQNKQVIISGDNGDTWVTYNIAGTNIVPAYTDFFFASGRFVALSTRTSFEQVRPYFSTSPDGLTWASYFQSVGNLTVGSSPYIALAFGENPNSINSAAWMLSRNATDSISAARV